MAKKDEDQTVKGKIKTKAKGKVKAKMALWFSKTFIIFFLKVLPILLAICAVHTVFSWIADLVESTKNADDVYEAIGSDTLSELICVSGNEKDGYYLAYKQGIDEKLDEIVENYNRASRQYLTKDILKKMLDAELYTQYPNLGGKIGKEADIAIGESSNEASSGADFSGILHWPTVANETDIASYFGNREAPTAGASTNHGGIDISVGEGTEVYACLDGKVTVAQYSDSAGNYVEIDHGNGYVSKYMHNSQLKVSAGDQVTAGQCIALSGNTGISTGAHLHFQIEKDGEKVDPLSFNYDNGMGASSSGSTENSNTSTSVTSLDGFLFIGDSITVGMQTEANVVESTCTVRAEVGKGSSYWIEHYSEIESVTDVKGINVLLGANDYDYAIGKMKELLEKLHTTFPSVTIYVDNLLPDTTADVDTTKRNEYVSDVKEFCNTNSTYLKFIDPTANVSMSDDGLHPNIEGYKTLWNNIKNAILNGGGTTDSKPPLLIANDTGEGEEGFQGAIKIRRVTPNKKIGELKNVGAGDTQTVVSSVDGLGAKESIPDKIKKRMGKVSAEGLSEIDYDDFAYLTIPYYDFDGKVQQGHMIVNEKLADEVLLIFQELYQIKYPIEKMEIVDSYSGKNNLTGDDLIYASEDGNNTVGFTKDSVHVNGEAIDINPQINPDISDDGSSSHENAKKYTKNRGKKTSKWTDTEKAACITDDSEIYKIFTKYGWTWGGNGDNKGNTMHFEKTNLSDVETIKPKNDESYDVDQQAKVEEYLKEVTSGTWSVYAKDLKSDTDIASVKADEKMQSASVIKLFIMATVYDEVKNNNIELDDSVSKDVKSMITKSDNAATNRLIEKLGFEKINNYIKNNGYSNTVLNREMEASTENGDNYTSAKDAAKILEKIYKGTCVSKAASEEMLKYLKAQTKTSKIPAGVPSGVETANKTGELDNVENDAAIVFKEDKPYVLVVMSSGLSDTTKARENIVELSKIVYGETTQTESESKATTDINSKIYDLKYVPEEKFNKMISDNDDKVLEYFTLDGSWNLVTAKWSYSDDDGLKFSKNTAINYMSTVSKYTTPFEYLMEYYVDLKDNDFMTDFTNLILDSEMILAVEDNVTTTQTTLNTSVAYTDGTYGSGSSEVKISESVNDTLELTYVDTWFVKFSKKTSYSAAALNSTAGELTGTPGELIGDYKTTSYCYICNDDGNGNFGTSVTASGAEATPHRTVAIHSSGDPNGLKFGDQIMLEGDPTVYVVEDTGTGQEGAWIDIYVEPTSDNRGTCCINSGYGDNMNVYWATNVKAATSNDTVSDDKKSLMNTVAKVAGTVTDTTTTSTSYKPGPTKVIFDKTNEKHYIGSTQCDITTIHSIGYKYETGDSEVSGNEDKFIKLFKNNKNAKNALKPKWLITNIEKNSKTAGFSDLTKYLLYKLTGESYGVKTFDFSIYEPDDFSSTKRGGGLEQFKRWLHAWEGVNGSISADGTKYIIGDDGYGHPTVGYGIDIFNGGFAERFTAAGYSTSVGAEVDKKFVDDLEDEEINNAIEAVESKCSGLNLTQYQKYALVSRIFNCGTSGAFASRNGKDFVAAYTSYWNQDKDDEYKAAPNDTMYSHALYTNYMCFPNTAAGAGYSEGLVNRRKAEWLLFKTGYYDRIDEYYEDGGNIVSAAAIAHDYISSNGYYYSQGGDLPGTVKDVKNTRAVCCATFVSWTLYEAGYDWMLDCPNINYCGELLPFLESNGGKKIMNPTMDSLQAGDIVFYGSGGSSHTDIYIGDGLWYNCGGDDSVQRKDPYSKDLRSDAYCIIRFD